VERINILSYISINDIFYEKIIPNKKRFVFFLTILSIILYQFSFLDKVWSLLFLYIILLIFQIFFEKFVYILNIKRHIPLEVYAFLYNPLLHNHCSFQHSKNNNSFIIEFYLNSLSKKYFSDQNLRLNSYLKDLKKIIQCLARKNFFHYSLKDKEYNDHKRYLEFLIIPILYYVIFGFVLLFFIDFFFYFIDWNQIHGYYKSLFQYNAYIVFVIWLYYTINSLIHVTMLHFNPDDNEISTKDKEISFQTNIIRMPIEIRKNEEKLQITLKYIITLLSSVLFIAYLMALDLLID